MILISQDTTFDINNKYILNRLFSLKGELKFLRKENKKLRARIKELDYKGKAEIVLRHHQVLCPNKLPNLYSKLSNPLLSNDSRQF